MADGTFLFYLLLFWEYIF